ncbi:MAG: DUF1311 domain-containing protein [Lachnospiraceae bacterium]|nr:DUF1311 domain-containing protein [Lachnospiraceae bacterium]
MKKKIKVFTIAGILALFVCSCTGRNPELNNIPTKQESVTSAAETTTSIETASITSPSVIVETTSDSAEQQTESGTAKACFPFTEFKNLKFVFSSGAGGWATELTIQEDGSFSGEFYDGELGMTSDTYPNGTMYQSDFTGQFTQPVKVNEYTYSMQISSLTYAEEAGTEEIKNGMLFCYSEAYGLDEAENILIYLPGAPLTELPQEFRSWVGYYDLSSTTDTELPFYALYNETPQCGFSSYDVLEQLELYMRSTEESAAAIESYLQNEAQTQTDLNLASKQLYDMWDSALNHIWDILNQISDAEAMASLTKEELEWIAAKEKAVTEAGAEYEGGSMQPMVMNLKAAELTKERVYKLLELLD